MITRAALGLAGLLASAPLVTAAAAADWDRSAAAAHHHARAHHGHHMHHGHRMYHGRHASMPRGHRRVLYRNPAYGTRWARPRAIAAYGWHGEQRWPAAYRAAYVAPRYAYPLAGSYVGGGLIGALYNQPACYCR